MCQLFLLESVGVKSFKLIDTNRLQNRRAPYGSLKLESFSRVTHQKKFAKTDDNGVCPTESLKLESFFSCHSPEKVRQN